jgi:hypothetical protein
LRRFVKAGPRAQNATPIGVHVLTFSNQQFSTLAEGRQAQAPLQIVAEWLAVRRALGNEPAVGFDQALRIARHVLERLKLYPEPASGPVDHALVHAVLNAGESGATRDQLNAGLNAFLSALPAAEAAFILFDACCETRK